MDGEKNVLNLPQNMRNAETVAPDWPEVSGANARAAALSNQSATRGPFVPMLLGGVALLGMLAFQSAQLLMDREALQATHASQQQTVDNAGKLRTSLDTLAADTQRMADAGNANARVLVEELKKRGVTINAAQATPPVPPTVAPPR